MLTLALMSLSVVTMAQDSDTVRMVITNSDGTTQVVHSKANAYEYQNNALQLEEDVPVSTPKTSPSFYRSGQELSNRFFERMVTKSASGQASNTESDYIPNDPYFDEQIHWLSATDTDRSLNNILSSVQRLSPLRRPVVGVIDSGFYEHPDLSYADGYNFATAGTSERGEYFYIPEEFDGSPSDRISCTVHGTGVAGVAVAVRDNSFGFAGIVDADFIAGRSMDCGGGFLHDSADALLWQVGEPVQDVRPATVKADVVNMSLGGKVDHCPNFMEDAINKASASGVPVVVAIGNHNIDASGFTPANCKNSIAVAAATREGDLFPTSNYGTAIDIAALGEDVVSATEDPDSMGWWEESSFATPIVTGVIANVVSEHDHVSVDEIKFFLSATALPFVSGQCDDSNVCGAGILDADAFTKAVRDYKENNVVVLKPALSNTELCDKTLYITDDNERARLCETYELILPEHQSNRDDIRFEVMEFAKGADMTTDAGALALTATSSRMLVSSLDTQQFDYGVRMCNSERCFGNAPIKLNDLSSELPEVCRD